MELDAGVGKGLMGEVRPVIVDGRNVVYADGFVVEVFVYVGIGRGEMLQMLCLHRKRIFLIHSN